MLKKEVSGATQGKKTCFRSVSVNITAPSLRSLATVWYHHFRFFHPESFTPTGYLLIRVAVLSALIEVLRLVPVSRRIGYKRREIATSLFCAWRRYRLEVSFLR